MDDNVFRIAISTDNHLGFMEKDPIRCEDSFASFEEVFVNAKLKHADFVLFAGDMFHDNKPSRRTMHSALDIFKRYCLGDEPIYTEILNAEGEVFKSLSNKDGKVNFENPYLSISLPVYSIHGNHDDPTREGSAGESLAAIDLLAVSNFVNYFGKAEEVDNIDIVPILMKKGDTYVALYGLGAG